jgi:hypothetical protein
MKILSVLSFLESKVTARQWLRAKIENGRQMPCFSPAFSEFVGEVWTPCFSAKED